ncbi:MAG: right-handed parallel beta-helix repeat-containing protein, partial [Ignavibacteriaceae bacterium]|nr:right-handed parallel beta-helix repeat-containing protein [Ignavibacteriaceae bacterium]
MNNISIKTVYLLILLITLPLHSEIRYVSKNGSAQPPYTSWATASDSIQKCINISSFGDTIYVGNGTYIEQVFMIHGLSLIGSGWDSCIIDTRTLSYPQSFYSVTMKDSCTIEGFHIIVTNTTGGIGISCRPGLNDPIYFYGEIRNNKISTSWEGISISNSYVTIKDNIMSDVQVGIDVFASGTTVLDSIYNNFIFNVRDKGIGATLGARAVIFNNTIKVIGDLAKGISMPSNGISKVYNNLLIDNTRRGYGITAGHPDLPYEKIDNIVIGFNEGINANSNRIVRNNILLNNSSGIKNIATGQPNVKYNNSWNNGTNYSGFTPDSTNLSVHPMFVNEDSLNFYLQMYSPLIDAGDPSILDKDSTRSDIGLYGGP